MGETTGISWTDATWNPWLGCRKVSAGCKNCYMFREQKHYGHDPQEVRRSKTTFDAPLKWKEPRRVFTCSWSDWFIQEADAWRAEAYDVIRRTPHTYQILTKRLERIEQVRLMPALPNIWLGVSIEDRAHLDRSDILRKTPAAIRFLSLEPLLEDLGYIDLEGIGWVIIGEESGPHARTCGLEPVRDLLLQCRADHVPAFVKQVYINGRLSKDPAEWPEDIRAQQFPEATR